MNVKKCILTFLAVYLLFSISVGKTDPDIEEINKRVENLENQKDNLEKKSEILTKEFELKAKELESKFREEKLTFDEKVKYIQWLLGFIALLGAASIISLYRGALKKAEIKAEEKVNERLDNIIENKKGELIELIKSQSIENQLKEESSILVLSVTEDQKEIYDSELIQFFGKTGFRKVSSLFSPSYKKLDKKVDVIVLNDFTQSGKGHHVFQEYVEKLSSEKILFIFLGGKFQVPSTNRNSVNFANSLFTFYSQILNVLKYQKFAS